MKEMKDHTMKSVMKSKGGNNGKLHHIYNNDIKRFQARKYSNDIKKKELEKKIHEKSSMLRKYAKLCAKEGIISNRVHIGTRNDDATSKINSNNNLHHNDNDGEGSSNVQKSNQDKRSKPNYVMKKIQKQSQQLLQEKAEHEKQLQEKLKQTEEAMKLRAKRHKAVTQKTSKGQPVLNNQIKLLLEKLKK